MDLSTILHDNWVLDEDDYTVDSKFTATVEMEVREESTTENQHDLKHNIKRQEEEKQTSGRVFVTPEFQQLETVKEPPEKLQEVFVPPPPLKQAKVESKNDHTSSDKSIAQAVPKRVPKNPRKSTGTTSMFVQNERIRILNEQTQMQIAYMAQVNSNLSNGVVTAFSDGSEADIGNIGLRTPKAEILKKGYQLAQQPPPYTTDFEFPSQFLDIDEDVETTTTTATATGKAATTASSMEQKNRRKKEDGGDDGNDDVNDGKETTTTKVAMNAGGDNDDNNNELENDIETGNGKEMRDAEKWQSVEKGNRGGLNEGIISRGDGVDRDAVGKQPTLDQACPQPAAVVVAASAAPPPPKSQLEELLQQPVRRCPTGAVEKDFQYLVPIETELNNSPNMQFYQPPPVHHGRNTPPQPASFAQPYAMNMQEETRQIMNLDSQQTSPTSSWNTHQYAQMSAMQGYGPRPPLYGGPPPPQMGHHNGPPQPEPTSNPYYHAHMQPMIPPGMQQQPYYSNQSPLTGTPPSLNYGNAGMPGPNSNGAPAPIFSFNKPRNSAEIGQNTASSGNGAQSGAGSGGSGGGNAHHNSAHRRKKQNDMSSPRFGDGDVDASVFPDMGDFPLLDVVQSKAKKDAGRKPCRPHLCEQSRMLISRVCHYHREFTKRLPPRHPLMNSPLSKPDQWTSQIMGISLATVRKCMDMAIDEEVFTRCTDKNLVNLTPSERQEREEMLAKLSTVFEDEKSLGAGTAGMTIAEYSPRRAYSNLTVNRQSSSDDKTMNGGYMMNGDIGSNETTLLNLDEHSNMSNNMQTPDINEAEREMGALIEGATSIKEDFNDPFDVNSATPKGSDTPKTKGRPRKNPLVTKPKESEIAGASVSPNVKVPEAAKEEETEKKTEDENESTLENEKKSDSVQLEAINTEHNIDREDDAASSEGTNRSETATPEPPSTGRDTPSSTGRAAKRPRRKRNAAAEKDKDESYVVKRGKKTAQNGSGEVDEENPAPTRMVTRARSRQP